LYSQLRLLGSFRYRGSTPDGDTTVTDGDHRGADGHEALELVIGGRKLRFPAVWLRDNCPCAQCVDPGSGQKFHDITDIPDELVITTTDQGEDLVEVTYAPGRHRSAFSRRWLAEHALDGYGDGDGRTEDDKELWVPADLDRGPRASWPGYLAEPADRARALDAVLRWGFVLLHCLSTADDGGDTGLVDGFAAAAALRAGDAEAFDVITGTPVPFGYIDKETELRASQPLIQLSPRGRIRGVRFNNTNHGLKEES
jgi:gamma-butyrobetaine dioxygenase